MVEWSYDLIIVWSGVVGSGVVRSYGPIERTYPMPLNPPFEAKGYLWAPTRYSIFQ